MQRKPGFPPVLLLIGLTLFQGLAPNLQAQNAPPPTPQQLDQLLAPVALYPDSLLAQITTASTNAQEILDVDNWLAQNPSLTGAALTAAAQQQGFDPAFLALVHFPTVVAMMAEHIDDYAAIGQAVSADQGLVAASVQRLRSQAYLAGSLRSTPQQRVEVQQSQGQPAYVIQPVNSQVVFLPQYDPTVVYARPATGAAIGASLLTFGLGIGITALLINNQPWGWGGWGWNWGGRRLYYNNGPWSGWNNGYRPLRPWYRPRPVLYGNRPGYGGNWNYRPRNYRPPISSHRPVYNRPGHRPNTGNQPVGGAHPQVRPTRPGTPNNRRPATRPSNRPAFSPQTKPTPQSRPDPQTKPAPQNRPTNYTKPVRPEANRPAAQQKTAGQRRPTGENRKGPS